MAKKYEIGYVNPDTGEDNPPIECGSTFELTFAIKNLPAAIMAKFCEGRVYTAALDTGTGLRGKYRAGTIDGAATAFTGVVTKVSDTELSCYLTLTSVQTAALTASNKGFFDCELYNDDATPYVIKPLGSGCRAKVVGEATTA